MYIGSDYRKDGNNIAKLLRILAALVDFIFVYVSLVVLLNFFIIHNLRYADIVAQVLFILYNIICDVSFHGQSVGKRIAQMQVNTNELVNNSVFEIGPRELFKILYFTPFVGIPMLFINLIIFLITGKMLEDYISKTRVAFRKK